MKTKIVRRKEGVEIQVSGAASHTDELIAAFEECRQGRCSCPTREYQKVESLSLEQSEAGITLYVKSKKGQSIDLGEIDKCLEHTKDRIK